MILIVLGVGALALISGTLLLLRVPTCPPTQPATPIRLSIIIPARNEEDNLPRLLLSLNNCELATFEVIVVDDGSTDATAAVAKSAGATVLAAPLLPASWTGKTWACAQGAQKARGDLLLFLDADTWLVPGGLDQLLSAWHRHSGERVALSLLPFHALRAPYEELALFFNVLMAIGAGGFGAFGKPKLFGQCLLVSRDLYEACEGHSAVRSRVLENLFMADHIEAVGGRCICLGGRGVLQVRMFPDGLNQLCESWKKAFIDGAAATESVVLALTIVWLTSICTVFLLVCVAPSSLRVFAAACYVLTASQVFFSVRQIGSFRWTTAFLYPIPLLFFFGLFASSLLGRKRRRQVNWRGRQI